MSDDHANIDLDELESFFAERTRWATLFVTIQEIADDNKALARDLSSYDPSVAVPLLASLLTLPEYQSQVIRLEILVTLATVFCNGRKRANIDHAASWFSQIGESRCVLGEDPAEDVFVSLVHDHNGNYRLLEGVWEAAGFYTQRVFEIISTMPDDGIFGQIKRSFRALLTISEMVCEKAGLKRYQLGSDEMHSALSRQQLPDQKALTSRVTVSFEELDARGISLADIEPFLFHQWMKVDLAAQHIGHSYLDHCPLIANSKTHLTVALPSALSVAMRDFAIAAVIEAGLTKAFDRHLADNYAELFSNTPLLGGPMHAPILWKKSGKHRWSNFVFEADQGYFISYHLMLPSVGVHTDGGFKSIYQDDGALTEVLQESIDIVQKQFTALPDFKEGLFVLVGCGWGKGYTTQDIGVDHPKWRFQSISAADLVRLSWLNGMSPGYFWRIQDGLEAVTKAGVHIVNPNGILNLIGWVRGNDGHFVPHEQLPEVEISCEQPLMLYPPSNLLREVRTDSDRGYDRHRSIDNTGTWHDVQHISPELFFDSESARRLYASMDDLRAGMLTTVYEDTLELWMSVTAPKMNDREIKYRLWEMANEWLHRIGSVLNDRIKSLTKTHKILKAYVEFQDADPPEGAVQKPNPEDLIPLCVVETYDEPNACKAVFKTGFLSGFRIAENTAERLFVRNLVYAFLHILEAKNINSEAEEITGRVVQNQEARSFHLFHAQKFMDYVRDTLPRALVSVDRIDDAAAKIGLGWRVIDRSNGDKIEGQQACTSFLSKVVDVLLSEVSNALASFERVSTLKRLVANSEKANAKKDRWRRTSAAIIGLHGNDEDTIRQYVEQASKFAVAGVASRVLTEIALCVCPLQESAKLSDIELSKLIARASLVIRIGGLSDAIHYNALPPTIAISPLGDILFKDEFGRLVVEPMLSRVMGDAFIADAPSQKKNYDDPGFIATTKSKFGDEFWGIWNNEMGFDLDEARNIIGALEDKGVSDHAAIFSIAQSEYFLLVCSDKVSDRAAVKFLEQFSLTTRKSWDKPPKGFTRKDIYPWRFGRRLSFVTRPILKVYEDDDPLLIVSPAALRKGFAYVVDGAYRGRLEQSFFQTAEMKNTWWGKASEGHSFNLEVAQRLSDAGWHIRENIGVPELLNLKTMQEVGDVDVFAWRPDREEVLVIECKDLSSARNYTEIAALLSNYQGVYVNGKADSLKKHLIRVSMLKDNLDKLRRFTGNSREQRIVSCLVCSGVVPMQYAKIAPLANTQVGSIEDILAL